MPRSRRNTRVRTPDVPPASTAGADGGVRGAVGAGGRPWAVVMAPPPVSVATRSAALGDDLDGRDQLLPGRLRVGRQGVKLLQVLPEVLLEVEGDVGEDLAALDCLLRLGVAAGTDDAGLARVLACLLEGGQPAEAR